MELIEISISFHHLFFFFFSTSTDIERLFESELRRLFDLILFKNWKIVQTTTEISKLLWISLEKVGLQIEFL